MLLRSSTNLIKQSLTIFIALVWFINGMYCKLLNFIPRHQAIVARILGEDHAAILTRMIGLCEIFMAVWVVSGIRSRWCTLTQVLLIASMNLIEFFLAPDLLLFGKGNVILAALLISIILINEYAVNKHQTKIAR